MIEFLEKTNCIREGRYGRIKISHRTIREEPDRLMEHLFSRFLPVRIESRFERDDIVYIGYSDLFEPVPEGAIPPDYEILFVQEQGETLISAVQLKGENL